MFEVASALGAAIQVDDTSLWRLPTPPPPATPASAPQQQRQQQQPLQEMRRGADYHTYEEVGILAAIAGRDSLSTRSTAAEAERAPEAGVESTRSKPRKSRQKEVAEA